MPKGIPKNGINKGWVKKGERRRKDYTCSDETKLKLRNFNLGKKLSEETKRKISENSSRWNLGKKFSEESRKKMSEAHKGFHHTEDSKKRISKNLSIAKMGIPQPHFSGKNNPKWKGGVSLQEGYAAFQTGKRRILMRNIEGSHSLCEWELLKLWYGSKCLRCLSKDKLLTVDHVQPISKGGNDYIMNIQPLCKPCNSSKRDKTIDYRFLEDDKILELDN